MTSPYRIFLSAWSISTFLRLAVILGWIKGCGSYFIFLTLYQENECIAHLPEHFPNLEISKLVKKPGNVISDFNPGFGSCKSENSETNKTQYSKKGADELIRFRKETACSSGSDCF